MSGQQQQMRVFVSHSHEDDSFCREIVAGLRQVGADVWYDEHNLASGRLGPVIERELQERTTFVVVISPAALHSRWVEDECRWAYSLARLDSSRVIQPITAAAFAPDDLWLFLREFKRIEAPGLQPFPAAEAAQRLLYALAHGPAGHMTAPNLTTVQPTESVEDLLTQGKSLEAEGKLADALPLYERATQLAPSSYDAWYNTGLTLYRLRRNEEALYFFLRASRVNSSDAAAWAGKGAALYDLRRFDEAASAYGVAIFCDPGDAANLAGKGTAFNALQRYEDALYFFERAISIDSNRPPIWAGMAQALCGLQRDEEAVVAYERATTSCSTSAEYWYGMYEVLKRLKRDDEANAALDRYVDLLPPGFDEPPDVDS